MSRTLVGGALALALTSTPMVALAETDGAGGLFDFSLPSSPVQAERGEGVLDLSRPSRFTPPATTGLREAQVYELARGISGLQSPLFLFAGFATLGTRVIIEDEAAVIIFDGVSVADGPTLDGRVRLEAVPVDGAEAFRFAPTTLPRRWDSAGHRERADAAIEESTVAVDAPEEGTDEALLNAETLGDERVRLSLSGPVGQGPLFQGRWSRSLNGFEQFDLDLGDIEYEGDGVAFSLRDARLSLDRRGDDSQLQFRASGWRADYRGSMDGDERADDIVAQISAPTALMSPAALLTLGNCLMSAVLGLPSHELDPANRGRFVAPTSTDVRGLVAELRLGGSSWNTASPPASGSIGASQVRLTVTRDQRALSASDAAVVALSVDIDSLDIGLENNRGRAERPTRLAFEIAGLDSAALAGALFALGDDDAVADSDKPERQPTLSTSNLALSLSVSGEDIRVQVPDITLDAQITAITGEVALTSDSDGAASNTTDTASAHVSGRLSNMSLNQFPNREGLEPMASNLIEPMLPEAAQLDLRINGIDADAVRGAIEAAAQLDLRGLLAAIPRDVGALAFSFGDTRLRTQLLDLEVGGGFDLSGGGRVPLRGQVTLQSGPLVPIQTAIQRSLSTPIPELVQLMSGAVVGMTVLQSFGVPAGGGRFDYVLDFAGGLPTINGRNLPRLPGM